MELVAAELGSADRERPSFQNALTQRQTLRPLFCTLADLAELGGNLWKNTGEVLRSWGESTEKVIFRKATFVCLV